MRHTQDSVRSRIFGHNVFGSHPPYRPPSINGETMRLMRLGWFVHTPARLSLIDFRSSLPVTFTMYKVVSGLTQEYPLRHFLSSAFNCCQVSPSALMSHETTMCMPVTSAGRQADLRAREKQARRRLTRYSWGEDNDATRMRKPRGSTASGRAARARAQQIIG